MPTHELLIDLSYIYKMGFPILKSSPITNSHELNHPIALLTEVMPQMMLSWEYMANS